MEKGILKKIEGNYNLEQAKDIAHFVDEHAALLVGYYYANKAVIIDKGYEPSGFVMCDKRSMLEGNICFYIDCNDNIAIKSSIDELIKKLNYIKYEFDSNLYDRVRVKPVSKLRIKEIEDSDFISPISNGKKDYAI